MVAGGTSAAPLDDALRTVARSEGVLPLLQWAAGDLHALRTQAAVQLARRARLARLLDLLAADGIPAVVFKGAHLAHTCYPDPALRPYVDTDLLIRRSDAEGVRRVLEQSGHRLIPHVSGRFVMSQFHYVDGATGGAHLYDVHWEIANPPVFHGLLSFGDIHAAAVPLPALGPHAVAPSVPHALLIACVHRAAHHATSERLIWLNDIRLLLGSASARELDVFCEIAARTRLTSVCGDACRRASDLFGDVPVPPPLTVEPAAFEPTADYMRARSPLRQLWLDARALPWRDRATLIREHLFPPASYIRETSATGAPLAWAYGTRIVRGLMAKTMETKN
jgi:hypothetical protein